MFASSLSHRIRQLAAILRTEGKLKHVSESWSIKIRTNTVLLLFRIVKETSVACNDLWSPVLPSFDMDAFEEQRVTEYTDGDLLQHIKASPYLPPENRVRHISAILFQNKWERTTLLTR